MKRESRNAVAFLSLLATVALAGCADIQATLGSGDAGCTNTSNWFDRQRQLGDGNADPHAAAVDAPCRASWRHEDPKGNLYGSGD